MAKKSFRCKLVTPTAALVDDQVKYVSIPAWDGLMGILPGRAPILARLGLGELRIDFADSDKGQGGSRAFLVEDGFVKMAGDELTILAERAVPAENLTMADAEAELRAAQAAPTASSPDARATELEKRNKDRQRARAKMHLVKTRGAI
ncbi:MAG TPA: F0F1 ATP synthase subunit epsilon [Phycisphaerales bacterium]|nr:F0F1 ATP synthase subunit epsilon [Phycisphaerales bacterium]